MGAAAITAHAAFALAPGVLSAWDTRTSDALFRLRQQWPRYLPSFTDALVHVDINDSSQAALGGTEVTRRAFADATTRLTQLRTQLIAYDFVFGSPRDSDGDSAFANAIRSAGNVTLGLAFRLPQDSTRAITNIEGPDFASWGRAPVDSPTLPEATSALSLFTPIATAARDVGFLNLTQDRDGVFRRVPLFITHEGRIYPALSLVVACQALGVTSRDVAIERRSVRIRVPGGDGRPGREIAIPVDPLGNMIVNYARGWDALPHYHFSNLLALDPESDEWADWVGEFRGRVALVGDTTSGGGDVGATPIDEQLPLVAVHSNAINTIVSEAFLRNAPLPLTLALEGTAFVVLVAATAGAGSVRMSLTAAAVLAGYCVVVSWAFLQQGLIFPIIRPALFITLGTLAAISYRSFIEERDRALLRRTFEAYFPPAIVPRALRNPRLLEMSQQKDLTVLFSDIVGFTSRSASMVPEEVQRFLNQYFDMMVDVVFAHGGTVDKFIGDGLLVFFGDPEPQADHAVRAVRCARAMHTALRTMETRDGPVLIRVGIATGRVVVGNMGSARRVSYTVLGTDVNLAQRLEAAADPGGLLISERTWQLLGDDAEAFHPVTRHLKGLAGPVVTYTLVDAGAAIDDHHPGAA